jgi:hypothetical protein
MEGKKMTAFATAERLKDTGLDTLKVLAKKIAPGQECFDPRIEDSAKRIWYNDQIRHSPNMVFVLGSSASLKELKRLAVSHTVETSAGFYVWNFASRSAADYFTQIVQRFEGLSFWQVGLSRQYAVAAEYPLLGYFAATKNWNYLDAKDEMEQTECVRVVVHELLGTHFPGLMSMSAVLCTGCDGVSLPSDSNEIVVLDVQKSTAVQLVYKPATRHRTFVIKGNLVHGCIFDLQNEAAALFASIVARNEGVVWYFGKSR